MHYAANFTIESVTCGLWGPDPIIKAMKARFTYCPLDISLAESERRALLAELHGLAPSYWHFSAYRNCYILPVLNGGGQLGQNTMDHHKPFVWSEAGAKLPKLCRYLVKEILPLVPSEARVFILRTAPGEAIAPHIDTSPAEVGSLQEKLRVALSGDISSLYFYDENFSKVYISGEHRIYLLDGGHAHAVERSEEEKITICLGSPWRGPLTKFGESKLLHEEAIHLSPPKDLPQDWIEKKYLEKTELSY